MPQPPIRRIVTGHDKNGKAVFDADELLQPAHVLSPEGAPPEDDQMGFILPWLTDAVPASVQGPIPDLHGKMIPLANDKGVTLRIVDFPPGGDPLMHRTISLDFGIVLKGEIICELDDGVEKLCKEHDIVVQRGTIHAWKNVSNETVRMAFCLVPGKEVMVDGKPLGRDNIEHLEEK
ncbi:MAG: hypothetical protein Q9227_004721 [Pyrenula ochraceoflavens]